MTTNCKPDRPVLVSKPSTVSTTSAASATSIASSSSRSAGSRLLFGEIDTNSQRSSDSYASVCSLVLCESSTFLKFWLNDDCRERFIQHVPSPDVQNLRLVCHDFSVRAAPALFHDLSIHFKTSTFTRPARLAALDRIGYHVKTLRLNLPHSAHTFLPPLVDPETGAELSFTYTPQVTFSPRQAKYGDCGTTEILTRQYPPLFHAATNVPAFIRAFSSLVNLTHLEVSCPGYDAAATQKHRRSVVDFALVSLRIAVERSHLNALESLTLSPIHPGALHYLSPAMGFGADPRSMRCWARVKRLRIRMHALPLVQQKVDSQHQPDHFRLLQAYLRNFERNITHLDFRWIGKKSPMPFQGQHLTHSSHNNTHPALTAQEQPPSTHLSSPRTPNSPSTKPHNFPRLTHLDLENVTATASDIHAFVASHKPTLRELNLEDIELISGTWDDALAPLAPRSPSTPKPASTAATRPKRRRRTAVTTTAPTPMLEATTRQSTNSTPSSRCSTRTTDEIPIMLSPGTSPTSTNITTTTTTTPKESLTTSPRADNSTLHNQHHNHHRHHRAHAHSQSYTHVPSSPSLLLKPTTYIPTARKPHHTQQPPTPGDENTNSPLNLPKRMLSSVMQSTMRDRTSGMPRSGTTMPPSEQGQGQAQGQGLRRVWRGSGMLGWR